VRIISQKLVESFTLMIIYNNKSVGVIQIIRDTEGGKGGRQSVTLTFCACFWEVRKLSKSEPRLKNTLSFDSFERLGLKIIEHEKNVTQGVG
jgi:hypothetical protein